MDETYVEKPAGYERDMLIVALENTIASLQHSNNELLKLIAEPTGKPWTPEENTYLVKMHLADPYLSNKRLSAMCSRKFGRVVSVNAIRGALNRARGLGVIPPKRPNTTRVTVHEKAQLEAKKSKKKVHVDSRAAAA